MPANRKAWSLRGRVLLLAGSAVLLLFVTLGILIAVLKNSQAALVNNAAAHLDRVASRAAASYQSRSDRSDGLQTLEAADYPPPPPPPPLPASGTPGDPVPAKPPSPPAQRSAGLSSFIGSLLRAQPGIEGGFYRGKTDQLGGYAFPTHEGPGGAKEMPVREQPAIRELSRLVTATNRLQHFIYVGPHDVVLFSAAPVCDQQSCKSTADGALWLMQRLPGAESDRRRAILWSAFAFGLMALLLVVLAFAVLRQVDSSLSVVMSRLRGMESSLDEPSPAATTVKMVEFQRVLRGLDSLSSTLRVQRETELSLQSRLQQHERLAAIGQLAAGVAHELRNPLATIRLRTQLSQRSADPEANERNSEVVLSEVDRLDGIIQNLLTFARPVRLDLRSQDISLICRETALRWTAQSTKEGHTIVCNAAAPVYARVDGVRIRQVLDNLLGNSIHASGDASAKVEIECEAQHKLTIIRVADRGSGFTADAMRRAVEPFFTTRDNGTGLGLSISYEIVRAHNGELKLLNRPEGGAIAEVLLPVQVGEEEHRYG